MRRYLSPAKLNLFLYTVRKRDDGFTELVSFFHAINLFDTLEISLSSQDQFSCNRPDLPIDETNTVYRALQLFRKKTGKDFHVSIQLTKQIPSMAGLGGGSSNAATTLWALNELTEAKIAVDTLAEWGAEIGSDVPFFFSRGQAMVSGRGEIVQSIHQEKPFTAWLAKPCFGLSTPVVFRVLDFSKRRTRDIAKLKSLEDFHCFNDLEKPALSVEPRLASIKDRLLEMGFQQVVMTGSGTTFFCLGDTQPTPLEGVSFFHVTGITRNLSTWY